jgi:peptide chain release factor 1
MITDRLEMMEKRYEEINELLMDPSVVCDIKKLTELSKQQKQIEKPVMMFRDYKKALDSINDLKEMAKDSDPEIKEMAEMELEETKAKIAKYEEELTIMLLPKDPNDEKNVIVEIRGAAGGDEANIFAGDLFRMYTRYAEKKGFSYQVYNSIDGTAGGFSQIELIIKGKGAYSLLKYENGSHRVQRVPVTESNGRLQTSTATVLVIPEADEDVDIEINPSDLRIDIYRSSGCGGQGVNTTDSAVRITHLPTGLVVTCQNERSQIQNKEQAMKVLKTRLYELQEEERLAKEGAERRSKIGTGDRAEKIRTYNYPQNRVTDHRIGFTVNTLDRVMDGDLDAIIEALITEDLQRKLKGE